MKWQYGFLVWCPTIGVNLGEAIFAPIEARGGRILEEFNRRATKMGAESARINSWQLSVATLVLLMTAAFCVAGQEIRFSSDTVLSGNLTVPEGAVLTVEPGVSVLFDGYFMITVEGLLVALGESNEKIRFGCLRRERGSEEPPCWRGIEIVGENGGAVFRNCRFEGAYRIYVTAPEPEFDSCEFVGNHYAVYCTGKSKAAVRNCVIKRNGYGIVADFSSPIILDNVIVENTVGLSMQHGSKALVGRNLIEQNRVNTRTDETLGKNEGSMTVKEIWDMMRQLY